MDLLSTLQSRIDSLDEGVYSPGLRAVLLHIGTAFKHLSRGQSEGDETAFTDAIYRTNQAFEGSIKEAYRVLAGKEPDKVRPFDIENYLAQGNVFRSRVLSQFTNYRTEWRNPSTHDYKLDFDESEAFLAIISVSAFACLLLDQISERLAFVKSQNLVEANRVDIANHLKIGDGDLLSQTVIILKEFSKLRHDSSGVLPRAPYVELMGALAGFFNSTSPELQVDSEVRLSPDGHERADMIVSDENCRVLLEIKGIYTKDAMYLGLATLEHYMQVSGIRCGILFMYSGGREIEAVEHPLSSDSKIVVLKPKSASPKPGLNRTDTAPERDPAG